MNDAVLQAMRNYHWARLMMFDARTVAEKLDARQLLRQTERKLSDVRKQHNLEPANTDVQRVGDGAVQLP